MADQPPKFVIPRGNDDAADLDDQLVLDDLTGLVSKPVPNLLEAKRQDRFDDEHEPPDESLAAIHRGGFLTAASLFALAASEGTTLTSAEVPPFGLSPRPAMDIASDEPTFALITSARDADHLDKLELIDDALSFAESAEPSVDTILSDHAGVPDEWIESQPVLTLPFSSR